jgi:hypothetical protein
MTATLKDMVLGALDQAGGEGGGQAYLARQAEENPAAFMALLAKVIPLGVAGDGGGPLVIRWAREKPNAVADSERDRPPQCDETSRWRTGGPAYYKLDKR